MSSKFPTVSPEQEETAIEVVTALDFTPLASPLPARAVAEALTMPEEQAKALLNHLRDRERIEYRYEHPGSNLAETDQIVLNTRGKWFPLWSELP